MIIYAEDCFKIDHNYMQQDRFYLQFLNLNQIYIAPSCLSPASCLATSNLHHPSLYLPFLEVSIYELPSPINNYVNRHSMEMLHNSSIALYTEHEVKTNKQPLKGCPWL